MNVLKPHLQTTVVTLLAAGRGQREIARITKIDRKTIRALAQRFAAQAVDDRPELTHWGCGQNLGLL